MQQWPWKKGVALRSEHPSSGTTGRIARDLEVVTGSATVQHFVLDGSQTVGILLRYPQPVSPTTRECNDVNSTRILDQTNMILRQSWELHIV